MSEMLAYEFMQRALVAAVLIGLLSALVAFFVVLKRLSFIGVGVSHSAFGGVGLGVFLKLDPVLVGGIFAVVVAWIIGWISRRGKMHEDTVIGVFFTASMAIGVILLSLAEGYYSDMTSFLFGNILAVSTMDLWLVAGVTVAVVIFVLAFFKELLFLVFDEELASADGLPVTFLYFGLLTVVAVTVVVSVKVVGIVLSAAMLVIPAATGYELSKNYRGMLTISLISGVISGVGGLVLSFYYDLASGATIVLCATLLFLVAFLLSPRRIFRAPREGKVHV